MRKKLSLWIGLMVLILVCTMMQPSFASLIIVPLITALLFIFRKVAHIEGRAMLPTIVKKSTSHNTTEHTPRV